METGEPDAFAHPAELQIRRVGPQQYGGKADEFQTRSPFQDPSVEPRKM